MASICCSPPESLVPWLRRRSFRFGNSSKICSTVSPPSLICGGSSRFSSTSRLAKMPRSSGQIAMPSRAMRLEGIAMVSVSPSFTEPLRWVTMPMIDLSVVVLPAPLRPSSVTTSPRATSNEVPCRMCDSPYHELRSRTLSRAPLAPASDMCGSEIGLHDVGILRYRSVVAFREHLATREHRDMVGERRHDRQVVLDHEHRPVGGDLPDQRRYPLHV